MAETETKSGAGTDIGAGTQFGTEPGSVVTSVVPRVRAVRPTEAQMEAARDTTISDVVGPNLRVLFCGINPGLWSAAVDAHFARPGNRFWPALHGSGFTSELLGPSRQREVIPLGLGLTNVAARATARADELSDDEIREGGRILLAKLEQLRPRWIAVLGIGAYRTAFGRKKATVGPQPELLAHSKVWVLPNPSGLNAHWTAATLAEEFGRLRAAAREANPRVGGSPETDK